MKLFKILSVFLACVIILGGFGMSSVSAAQYDTSPLQNTFYKLKTEKKLEIRYIGGSVTGGHGASNSDSTSWRALTTKWFKEQFPDVTINAARMAIGGTGTIYALHRVEQTLLNKGAAPDLVFIETAVNDTYDHIEGDKLRVYYESLIKKIYNKNPKCDIVILITGNNSTMKAARKSGVPYRPEHRDIANHYNIPVVDIGAALYQKIFEENGNVDPGTSNPVWTKYFKDSVHPVDAGYAEYAKTVQNYLSGELSKNLNSSVYSNKNIPQKTYMQNLLLDAYNVDFSTFDFQTNTNFKSESYTHYSEISTYKSTYKGISFKEKDDTFTVEFTGTSFMLWSPKSAGTTIAYSIDGGKGKTLKLSNSNHKVYALAEGLSAGKHKIKITHIGDNAAVQFCTMFIAGDPAMSGNVKFTIDANPYIEISNDSSSDNSSSAGGNSSSTGGFSTSLGGSSSSKGGSSSSKGGSSPSKGGNSTSAGSNSTTGSTSSSTQMSPVYNDSSDSTWQNDASSSSESSSANNNILIWVIIIGVALLLAIIAIVFYIIKKKLIVLPIVAIVIVVALMVAFLISLLLK